MKPQPKRFRPQSMLIFPNHCNCLSCRRRLLGDHQIQPSDNTDSYSLNRPIHSRELFGCPEVLLEYSVFVSGDSIRVICLCMHAVWSICSRAFYVLWLTIVHRKFHNLFNFSAESVFNASLMVTALDG